MLQGKKICKDMVIRIIRELNGKTLYADTPVLFLSCVKHIRKLTSEEISTVYKEVCDSFPISFYESDCR